MPSTTILCLGDSHTRGFYGSDWVSMLQRELADANTKLVRKGVDGQLSNNIQKRAAAAIADANANAPLAAVVLFCGTNDALCCSPGWRDFHARVTKFVQPGEDVSPDTFEASVRRMVIAATAAAPAVALVTLPPLDEHDLQTGPGNEIARELNRRLQKVAAEFPSRVMLIDLYGRLERDLQQHPPPPPRADASVPAEPHTPRATVRLGTVCLARKYLLRQSWDRIAEVNGGRLLTDRIHLSDAAGRVLCEALLPWARQAVGVGAAAAK